MVKEDKEKEKMVKLNKLFISENNSRIRHIREENAREYKRNLIYENMDKKRKLLLEKKEKELEENAQKRKIKEEITKDKQIMMERLKDIRNSGEEYTKEEVNEYVLNGIKPKTKKKEDKKKKSPDKDNKKNDDLKENENEGDYEEAFITELPEK